MITLSNIVGFIITLFILSILVIIHEFGHFLTAKKFGIKVEEFGFGFPPKAWGKKIGETEYTVNWLPIGGFVKLYGEDEAGGGKIEVKDPTKDVTDIKRAFFARPIWQRATVVVAGVVMNALLAFFVYYLYMMLTGFQTELPLLNNHQFFAVNQTNKLNNVIISQVEPGSPADKAGLKDCSERYCATIIAVNGKTPLNSEDFANTIKENKGKKVTITVQDLSSKKRSTLSVTPRVNPPKGQGALGIGYNIMESTVLTYKTPAQKLFSGIIHPLNLMSYNFDVMKSLISQAIREKNAENLSKGISGPIGIVRVGGVINEIPNLKERFIQFLNLTGLLSISLAIFNILPIPALDGGRLFFILLEGVIGKKVSPRVEGLIHTIGMTILLALVLLVTFKDILQIFP